MKQKIKNSRFAKCMLFAGLLTVSAGTMAQAQRAAVTADPELGTISLSNATGFAIDASQVQADQVISMKIPVVNNNHGIALPAGSCKIKIGLGSKLVLDPQYNINNAGLGNYFKWSAVENSGQVQLTGELIAPLPASVTAVNVAFKVQASKEGRSTITANFLITNHNTSSVLSDENSINNATSLPYRVVGKVAAVNAAGKLQLSVYPNPAKDVRSVMIKVEQGELKGRYSITLTDMAGKLIQSKFVELNALPSFTYSFGNIAAGKYLIKVTSDDAVQSAVLKFEKM
jgi:Secretion system C-terminal sorting domain